MIADRSVFRMWSDMAMNGYKISRHDDHTLSEMFSDPLGVGLRFFGFLPNGALCYVVPTDEKNGIVTVFEPDDLDLRDKTTRYLNSEYSQIPYAPNSLWQLSGNGPFGEIISLNCVSRIPTKHDNESSSAPSTVAAFRIKGRSQRNFAKKLSDTLVFTHIALKNAFGYAARMSDQIVPIPGEANRLRVKSPSVIPMLRMFEGLAGYTPSKVVGITNDRDGTDIIIELPNISHQQIFGVGSNKVFTKKDLFPEIMSRLSENPERLLRLKAIPRTRLSGVEDFHTQISGNTIFSTRNKWTPRISLVPNSHLLVGSPLGTVARLLSRISGDDPSGVMGAYAETASATPVINYYDQSGIDAAMVDMMYPVYGTAAGELMAEALRVAFLRHFFWFPMLRAAIVDVYPHTDAESMMPPGTRSVLAMKVYDERLNNLMPLYGLTPREDGQVTYHSAPRTMRKEFQVLEKILERNANSVITPETQVLSTPADEPYWGIAATAKRLADNGVFPMSHLSSPFNIASLMPSSMITAVLIGSKRRWR